MYKMETYHEIKTRHQEEFNSFPMFFAFSNRQFAEGMKKLDLEPTDTDKVYGFGGTGGYYRKTDSEKLHGMLEKNEKELLKALENDSFALDALEYELANHEFSLTHDPKPALAALGLDLTDIKKDARLEKLLRKAMQKQKTAV